jgi:hypothetical protein
MTALSFEFQLDGRTTYVYGKLPEHSPGIVFLSTIDLSPDNTGRLAAK